MSGIEHEGPAVTAAFGEALAKSLAHIEGYVLSHVVWHLLREGVFETLAGHRTVAEAAAAGGWDRGVLDALVAFLADNGVFERNGDSVRLTDYGELLVKQEGWFRLLVGGYGVTFRDLSEILRGGRAVSHRNEQEIAIGSGHVDRYDVVPVAIRMIRKWEIAPKRIVDLGAGSAAFLTELCALLPESVGVGVVLGDEVLQTAVGTLNDGSVSGRVTVVQGDAAEYSAYAETDLVVSAFVLQEVAYQRGVETIVALMERVRKQSPGAWWLVFEVPERGAGSEGGRGSYYNCYRLIHHLTKQLLLPHEEWMALFTRAGYVVVETAAVAVEIDPGGCETCYVLRPAGGASDCL